MKAKEREAMRRRVLRLCRALVLDIPSILHLAEMVAESEITRERRRASAERGNPASCKESSLVAFGAAMLAKKEKKGERR